MPRSIWNGSISFGLVNIPVKVYTATEAKELSFKTLCRNGHSLQYKKWCPVEHREVKWEEVKKGFPLTGGKFIEMEKEDFDRVRLPTTKTIEVQEFIDAFQVDPIFIQKSYFLAPSTTGEKAYALLLEILTLSNRVAVAKVVLREKEYVVVLRPYRNAITMHVLHYSNEIRSPKEISELKKLAEVKEAERKLAQILVEKLSIEEFDIAKFKDIYTESLKKVIEAKARGKEIVIEREKPTAEARNLMEALKASVEPRKKKKKGK
jgi:DNA end-binding protein Ku